MNPQGDDQHPRAGRPRPNRRRPQGQQADGHYDHDEQRAGRAGIRTHQQSFQHNIATGERRGRMQTTPYLTREDIQHLAQSDVSEIIRSLNTNEAGFLAAFKYEIFCKNPITLKYLVRILTTLTKVDRSDTQLCSRVIAQIFSTTGNFVHFIFRLDMLIKNMIFEQKDHIRKSNIQCLSCLIKVGMFGIRSVPKSILHTFPMQSIKSTVDHLSQSDTSLNDVKQNVNELDAHFASFREEEAKSKSTPGPESEEPPEHYTEVSILPISQEIHPTANKAFLRPNITSGKYQSWNHYLDIQFRLLREDFVGPLREGISKHCDIQEKRSGDIRVYHQVKVEQPVCLVSGVGFEIRFDQSQFRNVNWEYTNRLITGSLLCLSNDNFETVTFATIAQRKPEELKEGRAVIKFEHSIHDFSVDLHKVYTMVESMAYFEAYRHVLDRLQKLSIQNDFDTLPFKPYIVECSFSDVSRPSYLRSLPQPVFNLQEVLEVKKQRSRIALFNSSAWPDAEDTCFDHSQLEALKASLTQDLSVIQGPPGTGKTFIGIKIVQAFLTNREVWDPRKLSPIIVVCYTNHALDQFLEGIQNISIGGKKVKITRIGGRSRSEHLNNCLLYNKIQKIKEERSLPRALHIENARARSRMEHQKKCMIHSIEDIELAGKQILNIELLKPIILENHLYQLSIVVPHSEFVIEIWLGLTLLPWTEASQDVDDAVPVEESSTEVQSEHDDEEGNYSDNEAQMIQDERLLDDYQVLYRMSNEQLLPQETSPSKRDDEWEIVKMNSKKKKRLIEKQLLQGLESMSNEGVNRVRDVWLLKRNERWKLYRHWRDMYVQKITQDLVRTSHNYNDACEQLISTRRDIESFIVNGSDVIGMTTTGAAKHNHILKAIHPRVVVVEEAAEIFEPHILTSLSASVQQLILIGDHKQLRPKPNYYVLDKKYGFSVSLFERLVENNFPLVTLSIQHRMRPEIASLITPSIYPLLHNHGDVEQYECIQGVGKNLFFIHHSNPEISGKDDRSHSNPFEAHYLTALCDYLLKQGYQAKDITVLTTYRGQLLLIKQIMRRSTVNQRVRVAVVDDFQGEENEIILLSLVRSNPDGKIGFLNIENRVCVSLSRAKKGFYVIGNMSMLEETRSKWPVIISSLNSSKCLGEALPLYCQQHPNRVVAAKIPQDFLQCPEGGCQRPCETRLPCGHTCKRLCHSYDREHIKSMCFERCVKTFPCGHRCTKNCNQCSESCPPCTIIVKKILPSCGHSQKVPCSASLVSIECSMQCFRALKCGHLCQETCSKPCTRKCTVVVKKTLPCGHTNTVPCYQSTDYIECSNPCTSKLDCEHPCTGTCGGCHSSRLHVKCIHKCERTLVCGHLCDYPCTPACPPCTKPCTNFCVHSKCPKKCFEPCQPCMEQCDWSCAHYKCSQPCGKKCDRPPCNRPCMKRLKCGHLCIGLCGELCPKECRECNKEKVCEIFLGEEDGPNARFILLPDCGHIIEVGGLDTWMEPTQSATPEDQGEASNQIKPKTCPKCKTVIRKCHRYGNQIKDYLHDIEAIKQKQIEALPSINLAAEVKTVLTNLSKSSNLPYVREELEMVEREIKKEESSVTTKESMFGVIFPHLVKAQLDILALVAKIMDILLGTPTPLSCTQDIEKVRRSLDGLKHFISQQFISQQQINDAHAEGCRLLLLAKLINFNCKAQTKQCTLTVTEKKQISSMILGLHELKSSRVTDSFESSVKDLLTALSNKYSIDGVTDAERIQIVKAIGLQKGHWFKCPNGHYYCIGECGGATQTSTCPDCGSSIGGTSHRLVANNQLATEMDGALHAAWSETANLQNFDPEQLH